MYTFEFTSEYVKRRVKDSDDDRESMRDRKAAAISVEIPDTMTELYVILAEHAKKHVRCVVENPYI